MTIKRVHYGGDVPEHVKRFAEWSVGMPINMVSECIGRYRDCYLVCRGGAGAKCAWLGPWDGGDEWFVSLWC